MYKLLIKEKELMKWRLKNIIIFNYSNNKKFSILTILLYIYVYRNPKIRPRRVREENHPRLLQFPIPKNPREPYSSPMPKKIRVYSNGGRSARSCIQIGVLVTRTIFHENISGGGRRWAFKKEFERVSSVFLVRQATSCITILLQFPEQKLRDTFHHDVTGTKLSPVLFTFRPATSL